MMKFKGSSTVSKLLIAAVAFWLLAFLFLIITGDSFQFQKSSNAIEMLATENAPYELKENTVLEQAFEADFDRFNRVSIKFSDWSRQNTGSVRVSLLRGDDPTELASTQLTADQIVNLEPCEFRFPEYVSVTKGEALKLRVSSDAPEGEAFAPFVCSSREQGPYLVVDGEETGDVLCFSVLGEDRLWIGCYYWFVVAGVFALLACYCVLSLKRYRDGTIPLPIKGMLALRKYGFLIKQLVNRDFKAKYKRSVLGVFWSFLNPLLNMMVQYIVFSNLFRFSIEHFPVYLLCGNVIFSYFSESSGMALSSIVGNAHLITKVYVPKYIYPLTRIMSSFINLLISLIPLFVVALISGLKPTVALLLLPYPIVCLAAFCLGIGMLLSAAMVFFRDVQFLWGVLTTIWMYLTPIFYPVSILEENLAWVIHINPLYYFITFLRTIVISGISPAPSLYIPCATFTLGSLLIGCIVFKKTQDRFVLYL